MDKLLHALQTLDRRWIYLVLTITLIVTLIYSRPINPIVLPQAQDIYDAVDKAPAGPRQGKIILVGMTFSASTIAENGSQARALLRHLMLRHKRFAVMSISEPQGATYAPLIAGDIAKQYGYVYGRDWINFGYQIGTLAFFKAFPRDIPGVLKVDASENKPITSFPIMKGIKSIKDVALLVEITASSSVYDWIQIVQPTTTPPLKIGYACTGVMGAEAFPYLDSGQLIGMMLGLKGAADYEKLADELEARELAAGRITHKFNDAGMTSVPAFPPSARRLMYTQSAAHVVIIIFILLGNIGLLLSRWKAKKSVRKEKA